MQLENVTDAFVSTLSNLEKNIAALKLYDDVNT